MTAPRIALPGRVSGAALGRRDPARAVAVLKGDALGTCWQVRLATEAGRFPIYLRGMIEARLGQIVAEMSQWEPASLLSRFNRAEAGHWASLPRDFAKVMAAALDLAERTGGAFDPTHGRAAALLGLGAEAVNHPPSPAQLDDALARAGWRKLQFDSPRRLHQPGGLWLDFSGIAKGFAVDALADLLLAQGFADALIEIGGELIGIGLRPDGQPWWVDVEDPPSQGLRVDVEDPPGIALPPLRIGLHEMAVATSGNYRRGQHTLDPRSGRPLPALIASVTVLHDTAMMADGWATALTVLGPGPGLAMAVREGLAARIVTCDGAEMLSPALRAMIED